MVWWALFRVPSLHDHTSLLPGFSTALYIHSSGAVTMHVTSEVQSPANPRSQSTNYAALAWNLEHSPLRSQLKQTTSFLRSLVVVRFNILSHQEILLWLFTLNSVLDLWPLLQATPSFWARSVPRVNLTCSSIASRSLLVSSSILKFIGECSGAHRNGRLESV